MTQLPSCCLLPLQSSQSGPKWVAPSLSAPQPCQDELAGHTHTVWCRAAGAVSKPSSLRMFFLENMKRFVSPGEGENKRAWDCIFMHVELLSHSTTSSTIPALHSQGNVPEAASHKCFHHTSKVAPDNKFVGIKRERRQK